MVDSVESRLLSVRQKIADAAGRSGRSAREVRLVAVSKNHGVEEMLPFASLDIDAFGENRVQEARDKRRAWTGDGPPWRLIGHLQRNKARKALDIFDAVDSVDSASLALHLDRIAAETGRPLPILLEVNTSGESSKHGVSPEDLARLCDVVCGECAQLKLDGLMTVGPLSMEEVATRRAFALLRRLRGEMEERFGVDLPELSMGMSGDYEWAIEEGATMVRVGTALFGPRKG